MRMHIVSTLRVTSAVSVIQDSLEMDTTVKVRDHYIVCEGHIVHTTMILWVEVHTLACRH